MEDVKFFCSACGEDHEREEGVLTECNLCKRIHCNECVDEFGKCVACSSEE